MTIFKNKKKPTLPKADDSKTKTEAATKKISKTKLTEKQEQATVVLKKSFMKKTVAQRNDHKSEPKADAASTPVHHVSHDNPETKAEIAARKAKIKQFKEKHKELNRVTRMHSKTILNGEIVSLTNNVPDPTQYVIELFNVKKSYLTGDLEYEVLKGVDLKIKKGNFVVILGPSGSGKTTLLNIISGLDKPNNGDVFVAGYNLTLLRDSHLTKFRRDNVGFIFQQYNLLTNLTARENAEVGENLAKNKNKNMGIDEIFNIIEMDQHMDKFPSQLSGGQQQRVSIGRALAKNPAILFCDEPTGALDEEMGRKVLEILLSVNKEYKTSIIMVTHNPNFQYVANTVISVKNGKIISVKTNDNPLQPSEINWS